MSSIMHKAKNLISLTLAGNVDDSVTAWTLAEGNAAQVAGSLPCYCAIDAEIVEVTEVDGNDITAGRGALGTTPAAHTTASPLELLVDAELVSEMQRRINNLEDFIYHALGGSDRVVVNEITDFDGLKVVAQGTPDMTVKVKAGYGMAGGIPIALRADFDTAAIVAPGSPNSRIDVVEYNPQTQAVNVVTGTPGASPVAPDVTAGCLALAEITLAYNTTSIINGIIADRRVFG